MLIWWKERKQLIIHEMELILGSFRFRIQNKPIFSWQRSQFPLISMSVPPIGLKALELYFQPESALNQTGTLDSVVVNLCAFIQLENLRFPCHLCTFFSPSLQIHLLQILEIGLSHKRICIKFYQSKFKYLRLRHFAQKNAIHDSWEQCGESHKNQK